MFTGIVTDVGRVAAVRPLKEGIGLRIDTAYDPAGIDIGASISCAGVCLTVTALPEAGSHARWFEVEAWEEALRLTTASAWRPGTRLNLERALKIGDELGGHIVSGHVDGTAEIVARTAEGDAVRFTLEAPRELARKPAPPDLSPPLPVVPPMTPQEKQRIMESDPLVRAACELFDGDIVKAD